ncbi:hypothetical protein HGRIS_008518 [Hohenbuehelia grisea]|uniref:Rab-GAP TBC domain-containing protein n=1 Tax=Hohenbuehelia grisea TaxID=104357 RepID=A0ABR3J873_9AGAR
MDGPALVVLPPTPTKYSDSASSSANPSPLSSASSRPSSCLDLDQARASSETTIFTIYSMYGDEHAAGLNRASWSPAGQDRANAASDRKPPSMASLSNAPAAYRGSLLKSSTLPADDSELAYYDPDSPKLPMNQTPAFAQPIVPVPPPKSGAAVLNGNGRASYHSSSRPASYILQPDYSYNSQNDPESVRTSEVTSSSEPRPSSSFTQSRESSNTHESYYSARNDSRQPTVSTHEMTHLPPIPPAPSRSRTPTRTPPPPSIPHASTSTATTVPVTPPRARHISPQQSPSQLQTPRSLHPASSYTSSPGSKISLVPSEGEDMDAFHVRNTYAQLEVSGVKGDGYEEGVERTRARVGTNRQSQKNAEDALGDGSEKRQTLKPGEVELLRTLDRYGFFSVPSHDRLVLLPSAPLTKRLSPVSSGPANAPSHAKSLNALPPPQPPLKETSRIAKWQRMLIAGARDEGGNIASWTIRQGKEHKVRERVYKGIPDRWRSAAWDLLMGRYTGAGGRDLDGLAERYRDTLDRPSSYDIQIDLDVPRTISGHVMFRTRYGAGQRSLFHVLHCFSLHCETCGYVQGMGPIAATLLNYVDPARAYAALVRLHDSYGMHTIFAPGFPGLLEAIYVQERMTETLMPDVYKSFKNHMVSTTAYATKWYITLFANSVPYQTQLRLWDVFLLEGPDLFIAVAVAIVWAYRDHITSSSANFETILSLLSSFFVPQDENVLLTWIEKALGDKKMRANMRRWRHDWGELVKAGKEGSALL